MPNYVKHIVNIKTTDVELEEILNFIKSDDRVFDFNKIIPMPEALNIQSRYDLQQVLDKDRILNENEKELVRKYSENYKNYGFFDWYGWRISNWGTKWNTSEPILKDQNILEFQTAWSHCAPIFFVLSNKFPKAVFEVNFADEDRGYNTQILTYQNGAIINKIEFVLGSQDAEKNHDLVWEYTPELDDSELDEG